jgi:hypothetical protein
MWGGGLLGLAGLATTLWHGETVTWQGIIRYDPMQGWWFLDLGRNVVFATEAFYHALALGALFATVRGRWGAALACVGLLVVSSPFAGLQFALVFAVWSCLEWLVARPTGPPAWFVAGTLGLLLLHLGYYLVFLPADPRHAAIYGGLKLDWRLPKVTIPLAYGLVAAFAGLPLLSRFRGARPAAATTRLLLALLVVSFALANHELLIAPHQPIHFTRGYMWLALFLLGAPALNLSLQRNFGAAERRLRPAGIVTAAVCVLLPLDNAAWVGNGLRLASAGNLGIYLPLPARQLYADLERSGVRGVALLPPLIDYPAALYTHLTPYTGHWLLTPNWRRRILNRDSFYRTGNPGALNDPIISIVVVPPGNPGARAVSNAAWTPIGDQRDYIVVARPAAP